MLVQLCCLDVLPHLRSTQLTLTLRVRRSLLLLLLLLLFNQELQLQGSITAAVLAWRLRCVLQACTGAGVVTKREGHLFVLLVRLQGVL